MHPSVKVQIAPSSVPATPSWFGEVAVLAHVLTQFGVLDAIQQRARFARARFGLYDTIDFVVVLIGYAVSGVFLILKLVPTWHSQSRQD